MIYKPQLRSNSTISNERRITYILIVRKEGWKKLTASPVQKNRIFVPHCSKIHGLTTARAEGLLHQENLIIHPYNLFSFKFYHCKIFT
jgi:hypothetical protein